MVEVPAVVRTKAIVAGADDWLDGLDDVVAELAQRWQLRIGDVLDGGTEALVLAVDRSDGTPAVLKLLVPRDGDAAVHEISVLRRVAGDGCVRLLDADGALGAMLLERVGPSLADLDVAYDRRLEILADLARRVWRPVVDLALPTGAEKATWLIDHIEQTWGALDRPCDARVVHHAVACAERRRAAHDDGCAVLVHGDVHQWNALRRGDGWALIDPDGLVAEAEYDLGVLLREDPEELLAAGPWAVAGRLAERCGVDAEAAWEWGVVERVSTGLLCERIGLRSVGRQMLRTAEALAPGVGTSPPISIRPVEPDDRPFLERMLACAADWRPEVTPRPVEELLADPALAHYVADWPRAHDLGVIAEDCGGEPVGAAWARRFPEDDPGYGYVGADVHEVSIGVIAAARGLGYGRRLLEALADAARDAGAARLSLSVEQQNPAMRLYAGLGYTIVGRAAGSATMILDLDAR